MLDMIVDMIDEHHERDCEPTLWRFSNHGYHCLLADKSVQSAIVWGRHRRNGTLFNIPIQIERLIPVGPRRRADHRVHLDDAHGHIVTREL